MKKRILMVFLLIALLVTTLPLSAMAADPTLTVETVQATAGRTVTLAVDVGNNPGFSAAKLKVNYDTTRLELTDIALGEKYDSGTSTVTSSTVAFCYAFNRKANDTLLKLTFRVLPAAAVGMADVSISYEKGDICSRSEEDVDFTCVPGGVNVVLAESISVSMAYYKRSLSLSEIMYINPYFTITATGVTRDYIMENGGLLVFRGDRSGDTLTYGTAQSDPTAAIVEKLLYSSKLDKYSQQSMGIPAKYYDMDYTFVAYLLLPSGEYVYSDPHVDSVYAYCDVTLEEEGNLSETDLLLQEICANLKLYGQNAKSYFQKKGTY